MQAAEAPAGFVIPLRLTDHEYAIVGCNPKGSQLSTDPATEWVTKMRSSHIPALFGLFVAVTLSAHAQTYLPLSGGTMSGTLQVGTSSNVNSKFYATATGNQLALLTRSTSSASDIAQFESDYTITHTATGGNPIIFNTSISTSTEGSTPTSPSQQIWNFFGAFHTKSGYSNLSGPTQVAAYFQATRDGIANGTYGVPLEGMVIEMHDFVDQNSSTKGRGVTLEVDWAGNGTDESDVEGMASFDLSQASGTGSNLVVGNGIGFYTTTSNAYVKRVFFVGTPFAQAVLDTRSATQLSGANAVWLASSHHIAWGDGSRFLTQSGSTLTYTTSSGTALSLTDVGSLTIPGIMTVGASYAYVVGTQQVVGARITGWGTASGGSRASFSAGTATLAQSAAAVAQLIADLRTHGLIGN